MSDRGNYRVVIHNYLWFFGNAKNSNHLTPHYNDDDNIKLN